MADLVGRTIGNYVVEKEVGRGGMGAVYRAEHPRLKRHVAVKVLHPEMSRDAEMVARFFNEARAASDIKNAHIVDILDFGELPDGTSYLIMEWLEGRSLSDVLKREPRMPLGRVAHIMTGVGRALAAAHGHGVVHRDLKPDNIFLVRRDEDADFVKVLDFGIAKLLVAGDGPSPRTATNVVLGTPAYMSPEQCRGESSTLDGRSDIYSLGVILYEMATGRRPFNAETYTGILVAHVTQQPPPPRSHQPAIPEAAERVILRALEKERDKRFARVEDLINEFAAAVGVPGITAPGAVPAALEAAPGAPPLDGGRPGAASGRSTIVAYAARDTQATPSPAHPSAPSLSPASMPAVTPSGPLPVAETPSAPSLPPIAAPSSPSLSPLSEAPAGPLSQTQPPRVDPTGLVERPVARKAPLMAFAGGGVAALVVLVVALVLMRKAPAADAPPIAAAIPTAAPLVANEPPTSPAPLPPPRRIDYPINPAARVAPPPTAPEPAPAPTAVPSPSAPAAAPSSAAPITSSRGSHGGKHGGRVAGAPPIAPSPAPSVSPPPPPPSPAAPVHIVPAKAEPPARTEPPAKAEPRRAPVEEPADDLDRKLSREAAAVVPGGKRFGPKLSGAGEEGKGQDRFVQLEGGKCYTFVTVGSESMGRIYAYLWDPAGKRVATDKPEGLVSHFNICAPVTGQYHFQGKPARGAGSFKTAIYVTP